MKSKLIKLKNLTKKATLMFGLTLVYAKTASANNLQNSKLVTGTKQLLTDATTTLLWLAPAITVVLLIWHFIKLQNVEDDGEAKPIKKKMKIIAFSGIAAFLVDATFNILLRYYQ